MKPILALAVALVLAGCSAPATSSTISAPPAAVSTSTTSTVAAPAPAAVDAATLANKAKQATSTKVVTITEDNDPNSLIGRPGGYVSAAVIYDAGVECTSLGTSCGAGVEVFATAADAQARSDFILKTLKSAPALGTEYHTVNGAALLRVNGKVKPSVAQAYATAFTAVAA